MLSSPALCPLCEQNIDIFGDHALCCRKVRDLIVRHNRVRNWVFKLADQGLLSPEIEKKVLGPTDISKRRPGDVAIPLWSGGKGLAIDVAVTCPVAAHNISIEAPCEHYALHQKYAKYGAAFKGSSFLFAAMVFESSGVNEDGISVLAAHPIRLEEGAGGAFSFRWPRVGTPFLLPTTVWWRSCPFFPKLTAHDFFYLPLGVSSSSFGVRKLEKKRSDMARCFVQPVAGIAVPACCL